MVAPLTVIGLQTPTNSEVILDNPSGHSEIRGLFGERVVPKSGGCRAVPGPDFLLLTDGKEVLIGSCTFRARVVIKPSGIIHFSVVQGGRSLEGYGT